jgi:acyl-CoA reductase-like NAD-dependent aldehyde dehydrogenase
MPADGEYYTRQNPAHPEEVIGEFPSSTEADIDAAVAAGVRAAPGWAETPGPQRGALLFRFAQLLEDSSAELARIITLEQGKPLCESAGEVGRAVAEVRFMAGEASRPLGAMYPSERKGIACYTVAEPLGAVAAICPWNFPVVSPVRKIAPALAYGNTVVLKPSPLTPGSAVFMMRLLEKAGAPAGVVNLVLGPAPVLGGALVTDLRVNGISFTGSTRVGLQIAEAAARRLASVQLELGGKNPALVLDYGDLDGAAREIISAAFLCSGQRCTALSRVIVLESQADSLVAKLRSEMEHIRAGDGILENTTMGPLVSRDQFDTVQRYVLQSRQAGLTPLLGGEPLVENPEREGYYFGATLFDHVSPESPLAKEEIFGPVLPVIRVRDAEEALSVANATHYGLAAALFTSRQELVPRFIASLDVGMIHVNHGTASQAHVPFGGRKGSGQGAFSIGSSSRDFFTKVKTIYVK